MTERHPTPARIATLVAVPGALLAAALTAWVILSGSVTPPKSAAKPGTPKATPSVALPPLPLAAVEPCRAWWAALPAVVRTTPRRPIDPGITRAAGYGGITVVCGAVEGRPAATETVYLLSGVCWSVIESGEGTTWTTADRVIPVSVTVPRGYDQPGQWVAEFSDPVARVLPRVSRTLAGCD